MGLSKSIKTPEDLWILFEAYQSKIKSNPITKRDFKGKDATPVIYELERPLTYVGFANYLEDEGIITTPDHYFMNYQERYAKFVGICSRIKRVIRQNQIEGGMAGIYNPSITQRLNGLVDKTHQTVKSEQPLFGKE